MIHATHTLRAASLPTYTPPATRRPSNIPASADSPAPSADFAAELTKLPDPAATVSASPSEGLRTLDPSWHTPPVATTPAAVPTPNPSTMAPTAQSLFGDNPWITNAGGTGPGVSYSYNPYYFATPQTAAKVAQMLGGTVVATAAITPFGPFSQNQPNQMVQMPDGRLINAGLIAGFYDHGYSQQTVDKMIAAEVSGDGMYS